MPRIPRYQQQTGPSQLQTPRLPGQMPATTAEAAGAAVQGVSEVAMDAFERASLASSNSGVVQFQRRAAEIRREMSNLQGEHAPKNLPDLEARLAGSMGEIAEALPAHARKRFLQQAETIRLGTDEWMWKHADGQAEVQAQTEFDRAWEAHVHQFGDFSDTPELQRRHEEVIRSFLMDRFVSVGMSEGEANAAVRERMAEAYESSLEVLANGGDWSGARDMLSRGEVQHSLSERQRQKWKDTVDNGVLNAEVESVVQGYLSNDGAFFEQESGYIDEAGLLAEARSWFPGDRAAQERAAQLIQARLQEMRRLHKTRGEGMFHTLMGQIQGGQPIDRAMWGEMTQWWGDSKRGWPDLVRQLWAASAAAASREAGRSRQGTEEEYFEERTRIYDGLHANAPALRVSRQNMGEGQFREHMRWQLSSSGLPQDQQEKLFETAMKLSEPVRIEPGMQSEVDRAVMSGLRSHGLDSDHNLRNHKGRVLRSILTELELRQAHGQPPLQPTELADLVDRKIAESRAAQGLRGDDRERAIEEMMAPGTPIDPGTADALVTEVILGEPGRQVINQAHRIVPQPRPLADYIEDGMTPGEETLEMTPGEEMLEQRLEETRGRLVAGDTGLTPEQYYEAFSQKIERLELELDQNQATQKRPDVRVDMSREGRARRERLAEESVQLRRDIDQVHEERARVVQRISEGREAQALEPVLAQQASLSRASRIVGEMLPRVPGARYMTERQKQNIEQGLTGALLGLAAEAGVDMSSPGWLEDLRSSGITDESVVKTYLLEDIRRSDEAKVDRGEVVPGARVSSRFGVRNDPFTGQRRMHGGMDLAAPAGTHIYIPQPGRVIEVVRSDRGYGNRVRVQHPDGSTSLFAHLSEIHVNEGDTIDAEVSIGQVGDTGRATGPHVHVELFDDEGRQVDPAGFLGLEG